MAKPTSLAKKQLRALDRLTRVEAVEQFYLAGGSAIALHLAHRRSLDLDLFSESFDVSLRALRDVLVTTEPHAEVLAETDAVLKVRLAGEPVDFVRYPYPLLDSPGRGPSGVKVAGLRDLATMKLSAISRRGIRRDFWDMYAILDAGLTLKDAAAAYVERFGLGESDLYHVARSLTYFADAEKDPAYPRGLSRAHWDEIKRFFAQEAPGLL